MNSRLKFGGAFLVSLAVLPFLNACGSSGYTNAPQVGQVALPSSKAVEESPIIGEYLKAHGLVSITQVKPEDVASLRTKIIASRAEHPLSEHRTPQCNIELTYLRSTQSVRTALCGAGGYNGVNTLGANQAMYVTETVKIGAAPATVFEVYQPTRTANATGTLSVSGVVKTQATIKSAVGGLAGAIGSWILGKTLDSLWDWYNANTPDHAIIPNYCPPDPNGQPVPIPALPGSPTPSDWVPWPTPTAPPTTTTSIWEPEYPGGPTISYADDGSDGNISSGGGGGGADDYVLEM